MTVRRARRHAIPDQDREPVRKLLRAVESVGTGDSVFVVVVPESGEPVQTEVPRSLLPGIGGLVGLMAIRGEATVVDDEEELTPEQAAPLLGMSRPMVVHRIKQGDLPHRMVGTHHRIRLSDVLAFREAEEVKNHAMAAIGEHTDEMTLRHGA